MKHLSSSGGENMCAGGKPGEVLETSTSGAYAGGGRGGPWPPPPPTYTDRPKLKQLRHTLVWLVSLFGGSRAPSPAGSSLPVPVSISQQQLMNKMFQNMTLFVPSTIVIRTHSQMARPLSLGVVCKSGSGSVTIVT